jgi:NADPH:quinone reductase-like Zn-dependent oxidoreductase
VENIINTSDANYKKQFVELSNKLKPSTCLECISGDTTGEMLEYLGFKSTLILYGLLSDQPASGIKTIPFIGKAQTIESFLLFTFLQMLKPQQIQEIVKTTESMIKNELKTQVQAQYGFH